MNCLIRRIVSLLPLLLLLAACIDLPPDGPGDRPATASIEVFFSGDEGRAAALEKALVQSLAGAKQSVDMAMYNFNLDGVGQALLDAQARGVSVRIVADSDALDGRWFGRFGQAGIAVLGDRREELMHNKFLVIDGREVWTGSLNLTQSGTVEDDNNFVRLVSTALARRYTAVFEAMFAADQFGDQRRPSGLEPRLDVVGVPVEVYFSPEDGVENRLEVLLRGASMGIEVLAYSFTSDPLAEVLQEAAAGGVQVRGVFDESQSGGQGAEYARLRQAGLDVRLDGNSGLMHNKVLVIDGEIVVLGSYNFTRSANRSNDENLLVIHDAEIATRFQQEFERIYAMGR
jgi:phosphatidylserine/phosphatidylglycerophosphate/cardiolipin synthase-like enzyme